MIPCSNQSRGSEIFGLEEPNFGIEPRPEIMRFFNTLFLMF